MQFRQPLQTSCWMKTVSNSVRMMALVGQTSMHDACWQCLQTSDIISQACPPPVAAGCSIWFPAFGRCSMNFTCRQFWASSWPVLSKLSSSRLGSLPWRPFHSLQATSQALQPMQMLVSVKNPARLTAISDPHQIGRDLLEAVLLRVEVQGHGRQLVHLRHRRGVLWQVDRHQVLATFLAGVDAQAGEAFGVRVDRQPGGVFAAAAGADQPGIDPGGRAAAAEEPAGRADQGFPGYFEKG